jgi:TRAP-type C4-dicarboxylate transport system permease small subunit
MNRTDKIVFTVVAILAMIVVLLILFGCSDTVIGNGNTGLNVGDVLTLVIFFAVGIVMLMVGLAELRSYFRPAWRIGYRRDKPSFCSGISWLTIGVICIGMAVVIFCTGGKP